MSELQTPRAGDDRAPDIGVVALLGRGRPPFVRRAVEGGEQVVRDRLAEEKSAEETLAALDGMDTDDPGFTPRLMELRTGVQGHARAEGRYGFSHIRRSTDANLAAMAGGRQGRRGHRPHPAPPRSRVRRGQRGPRPRGRRDGPHQGHRPPGHGQGLTPAGPGPGGARTGTRGGRPPRGRTPLLGAKRWTPPSAPASTGAQAHRGAASGFAMR